MGFTINIDTNKVNVALKGIENKAKTFIQKELETFALNVVNDAKRLAPVDEGHLRNSISFNSKPLKVDVVVAADYAPFLEFGTKAFAAKYVSSLPAEWQTYAASFKNRMPGTYDDFIFRLTGWIKRKGIAKGDDIDQIAYIFARKIMITGIKPQPFLYPSFSKNLIKLKQRLNA